MQLKIKVPELSTTSGRLARERRSFALLWRRLRRGLLWGVGLFAVFLVFAWINMPTRAIAWRLSQEAKKKGAMVDIADVWISPTGKVTLYEVTWHFPPSRPEQQPVPFVVEEMDVNMSLWRYLLLGDVVVDIDGRLDEGHISGSFTRSDEDSSLKLEVEELPLYSVPKLQQSMNAPLRGLFGASIDLTLPDNKFGDANGTLSIRCSECVVGDGETKLYVPGAKKMLAKGVTVPEIELGSMVGDFVVEDGIATAEEFEAKSDDLTIKVAGKMELKDPFGRSRFDLVVKVLIEQQLRDSSESIDLLVATASPKSQMDEPGWEGWLGYKLTGYVKRPKFTGIKSKSRAERIREARENREQRKREAAEKRKEREAARNKAKADKKKDDQQDKDKPRVEIDDPDRPVIGAKPAIKTSMDDADETGAVDGDTGDEEEVDEEESEDGEGEEEADEDGEEEEESEDEGGDDEGDGEEEEEEEEEPANVQ